MFWIEHSDYNIRPKSSTKARQIFLNCYNRTMVNKAESQPGAEKKGRFLRFYKNFNKISAAVLLTAGVVFESPILLGLAAIDLAQVGLVKWIENRRKAKRTNKMGSLAVAGAT